MRTDFNYRRTVTTLTFCGSGMALTPLIAWDLHLLRHQPDHLYGLGIGLLLLLAIVLIGLSFTVAMRQISGSLFGNSFSASGGDDDGAPPPPAVTTTTTTQVQP
jgi:hypothetical protein